MSAQQEELAARDELVEEVLEGLRQDPKMLSPKWFYDGRGSRLFNEICELPEYYVTRCELEIMGKHVAAMARAVAGTRVLIEYGSGNSAKTRLLLKELPALAGYVPVDISRTELHQAARLLREEFTGIRIEPVCADFTMPFDLPLRYLHESRRLLYMPGSTLGNFEAPDACRLLGQMRDLAGEDGQLLIGIDLRKDESVLEAAYNDSAGVTGAFNLNALLHLNRRLGATFEPERFSHRAVWVESAGRIEMHLVSHEDQEVTIGNETVHIARDEILLTEYSHKYTLDQFAALAAAAGWERKQHWTDAGQMFSVELLAPAGSDSRRLSGRH
jgi:L-histidine Nalpha-methyltransferase